MRATAVFAGNGVGWNRIKAGVDGGNVTHGVGTWDGCYTLERDVCD